MKLSSSSSSLRLFCHPNLKNKICRKKKSSTNSKMKDKKTRKMIIKMKKMKRMIISMTQIGVKRTSVIQKWVKNWKLWRKSLRIIRTPKRKSNNKYRHRKNPRRIFTMMFTSECCKKACYLWNKARILRMSKRSSI